MAPIHFKSAVTVVSSLSKCKHKSHASTTTLEDLVHHPSHAGGEPPHRLAAAGKLEALKECVKVLGLSLKEKDKNCRTLLHHAAWENQASVVQYLLENGIEIDAVDKTGNTALHVATWEGSAECISLLLQSGASTTILNNSKVAPIHMTTNDMSGRALRAYLSHPGSIDYTLKGLRNRTLLHMMAAVDNVESCKALCAKSDEKFCACERDDNGLNALHLAARNNSHRVLDYMLQHCKNHSVDALLSIVDQEDSTPLHAAIDAGNLEVACVLLKYGACPEILKGNILPPLHLACSQGRLEMVRAIVEQCGVQVLQKLDQNGRSALHYSAFSIHSHRIISYIVESADGAVGGKGIDINQQDSRGRTPLHTAISSGNLEGAAEFLARGGDPFMKDNEGLNALHFAVLHNRKAIIAALQEIPGMHKLTSEVNAKGYSPVHTALKLGLKDIVEVLASSLQLQSNSVKDPHGNNYFHLAASSGDWKALRTFLELSNAHKLLNETNSHGATPLHYASKYGHAHCTELLLNNGAMVHKSHRGVSPLMLACRGGHTECIKLLYKAHPFQIDWQDDDGETALHYAAHSSSPPVVQQILDLGSEVLHNDSGRSFLDIIIADGDENCALAVVNHRRWQECLDLVSPVLEHPMLSLVQRMPGIAKAILDRCYSVESSCNTTTRSETFNFKYLLTAYDDNRGNKSWHKVAQREEKKSEREKSHPSVSSACEEKSSSCPGHQNHNQQHQHPFLSRRKTKQKLLNEVAIEGLEMVDMKSMTLHRARSSVSMQVAASVKKGRKKGNAAPTMEVLKRMIKHKRVDLLIHPIVSAYLNKKWRNYGRCVYLLHIISLTMLVLSLSMFVILGPSPAQRHRLATAQNNSSENSSNNTSLENNATSCGGELSPAQQVFRWLAVINTSVFAVQTVVGIMAQGWRFINFISRILSWNTCCAIVLNYVFLLSPDPFSVKVIPFGAGACFFTWIAMFGALEFFDVFGVYVNMFFKILRTVFHVLFVCIFLIMAFSLAMYMVASQVTEFSSVGFSLFSVFGYMLGEVQYSLFIEKASSEGQENLRNSGVIIVVIIVLVVMMSIVMANLLIGLAVGDIEQVRLNAIFNRRALEVVYFAVLDRYAPKFLWQYTAPRSLTLDHNRELSLPRKLFIFFLRLVKTKVLDTETEDVGETSHHSAAASAAAAPLAPVDVGAEVLLIKQRLQEMSELLHNMQQEDRKYGMWKKRQRLFRWQQPESSLSIDSSNSDISMTPSDFLTDYNNMI